MWHDTIRCYAMRCNVKQQPFEVEQTACDCSWPTRSFQTLAISEPRPRPHPARGLRVRSFELCDVVSVRTTAGGSDPLEECIAQHDIIQPVHAGIIADIAIDEEEHGQIDFFSRTNLLLFKAKALDFGKVRRDLSRSVQACRTRQRTNFLRRHVVRRDPDQILIARVLGRIERKSSFTRQHFDGPRLGLKRPR